MLIVAKIKKNANNWGGDGNLADDMKLGEIVICNNGKIDKVVHMHNKNLNSSRNGSIINYIKENLGL